MADRAALARELRAALRGEVHRDYPLARHTTYQIGGPADLALLPADGDDLARALALLAAAGLRPVVLGGGSNVLISDRGVREVVVLTCRMQKLAVDGLQLRAEAGVDSHRVALAARDGGLSGAEFLCCLPGSIGGACYMNARAFGGEVAQVLRRIRVASPSGEVAWLSLSPAQFSYKRSPLQQDGGILLEAELALAAGDPLTIQLTMRSIEGARRAKREMEFPSCGCVFKNDYSVGVPAGQLIERCGLKGYAVGPAQVSPFHANFVINTGGATAAQVRAVIAHVRQEVAQQTGCELELEVQLLGEWE